MTYLQALLLGVVQGLAEFLPISSSAHLALVPYWFGWRLDEKTVFLFGVLVQMGTLIAVIACFFSDLREILRAAFRALRRGQPFADPDARLGWFILLGTVPAGLIGLILKPAVESAFSEPRIIAAFLYLTAIFLYWSDRAAKKTRQLSDLTAIDALLIGLGQALAIFPGVSRSGATIAVGLGRGFQRAEAGRFSFLLSVPIMIAAGVLSVLDLGNAALLTESAPKLILAALTAAGTGFFAIRWFLGYLAKKTLTVFAVYCAVVATGTLILTLVR